jgi:RNA-directed DNA polymerase
VKETSRQERPPPVAGAEPEPPQGGEIRARWAWVEASVWTPRMLKALETGMGGGKWFRLIDKVWSEKNLQSALEQVLKNGGSAGLDGRSVAAVGRQSEEEIAILHRELRAESYEPRPVKRVWIPKQGSPQKRPLGVPTVRDRIVQTALRNVIEPIFERDFAPQSYGFRPGRGCKDALRRVDDLLKEGKVWVVDADIKGYFDTIAHGPLMKRVGGKLADGRVLRLIEGYLKAGVMESVKGWQPTERGTSQGAVISPLLANIYLDPLDWEMASAGLEMVRYADDFVVLCRSRAEARRALEKIQEFAKANGLTLHPEKTQIVDASQPGGFDFLGYHFERSMKWPRKKSLAKLREALRAKTRRTEGRSMKAICEDLNGLLRGWFEYFKHSKSHVFAKLDSYTRGRLRSILRKRRGGQGRGRGRDHQRWSNDFFHAQGLISLSQCLRAIRQSP